MAELGVTEALALVALPPQLIGEVLQARARQELGARRTRLLDLATAFHPGDKAKGLMKLSKMLEKGARYRPKLTAEQQAAVDGEAALRHLLG